MLRLDSMCSSFPFPGWSKPLQPNSTLCQARSTLVFPVMNHTEDKSLFLGADIQCWGREGTVNKCQVVVNVMSKTGWMDEYRHENAMLKRTGSKGLVLKWLVKRRKLKKNKWLEGSLVSIIITIAFIPVPAAQLREFILQFYEMKWMHLQSY